jgi:hypothetical protein
VDEDATAFEDEDEDEDGFVADLAPAVEGAFVAAVRLR